MKKVVNAFVNLFNCLIFPFTIFYLSLRVSVLFNGDIFALFNNPNIRINFFYELINFCSTLLIVRYIKTIGGMEVAPISFYISEDYQDEVKQLDMIIKDCSDSMSFIESNNPFLYADKTVSLLE